MLFTVSAAAALAERLEDLPKPTDYVSDFAHVLSPATVGQLDRLCGQLDHSKTNAQVAIVTVRSLDGDDAADYANRLEGKWKVGKKGSDRGILMLFAIQDHKRWIEVGYGLEGILPDAKVGDIGRMMVPDLRQRNYDGAVTTGLLQIANVIAADAHVTLQDSRTNPDDSGPLQSRQPRHRSGFPVGLIFRIVIIGLVLLFLGVRGLFGFGLGMLFGGGGRGGWGGGGGFGGSGGGSGGGDSGFGGFGGGESGGGGAGGDW